MSHQPLINNPEAVRPISEFITAFRKEIDKTRATLPAAVAQAWSEAVGERQAAQTELMGIKKRVLFVKVKSAPLMQELSTFKKKILLQKLTTVKTSAKNKITDIKFSL